MKKRVFTSIILFVFFLLVIISACSKEDPIVPPPTKQDPICHITTPTNGQEIAKGDIVTVSVDASVSDGSILEVRFFIDGIGKASVDTPPYIYEWETISEEMGHHTLKATSIDSKGGSTTDEITIDIVDGRLGSFTDPRDGQKYYTIEIGDQTWFAENLNYEISGSSWYQNNETNGEVYGRLYTWGTSHTACPIGWHLPSDDEWKTMEMYLGMSQSEADTTDWRGINEGLKLKNSSGWNNNGNGSNTSGFAALPGGYFSYNIGEYYNIGIDGKWWTATDTTYRAWYRWIRSNRYQVNRNYTVKDNEFSVRCVKD